MADLFETTVVDPSIPPGDILPIELMLLAEIFTLDGDNDRIYLHTENETAQILHLTASELSVACLETVGECIAKNNSERGAAEGDRRRRQSCGGSQR